VTGCYEHGNESSDSLKRWEFLEYIGNYQLPKEDSSQWNKLQFTLEDVSEHC
jgi:hypothetical protein